MADKYGRYKNLGSLGAGGQGEIYRVQDLSDPAKGEYALKRLRKVARVNRFQTEIAALKRIKHPNVIEIIDHSGDSAPGEKNPSYWFVMPIAEENLKDRVGLYRGNLDSVLLVAIQIADALAAVHGAGITHRDIKPENVLFPKKDHTVWLSDFGICHLGADHGEITADDEVVGPRGFTAPELEPGGPVKVTGAADVYSLGKVVYYMISGGKTIAREQIETPEYINAFGTSERHNLLRTLLARMIAPLSTRIQDMSEVAAELRRIVDWESHARRLALAPETLAAIDLAHKQSMEQARIIEQNQEIRNNATKSLELAGKGVFTWLLSELQETAAILEQNGTFKCAIEDVTWDSGTFGIDIKPGTSRLMQIGGAQLVFWDTSRRAHGRFALKFFICHLRKVSIQVGTQVKPITAQEPELAVVPYIVMLRPPEYKTWLLGGFLRDAAILEQGRREAIARTRGRFQYDVGQDHVIAKTFCGAPINLLVRFKASEWPGIVDKLNKLFSDSVKILVDFAMTPHHSCGG